MFELRNAAWALLVAVAGTAAAAPANAPKPRVAIVDVEAPPTMMGLSAQVTLKVLEAARKLGYPVVSPEEIRAQLGEKEYAELQRCHQKTTCIALHLAKVKADHLVVGTLGRDEKNYLVRLWLIDLNKSEVITDLDRPILIASRRLTQDVVAAMPGLLRGEKEARGTLKLSSNAPRVAVTVDGESHGLTPLTLELKPGKHEVRLEKKAYWPVTRLVTIEPNRVTDEVVRLIVIPGQTPEELAKPPPMVAGAGEGHDFLVPAGAWVAVTAAVGAGGAGTYLAFTSDAKAGRLRPGFDPGVTTGANTVSADRNAMVANVCFVAAGVALAAGILVTLVGNSDGPAPKVQALPAAGAGSGGLLLQGSF